MIREALKEKRGMKERNKKNSSDLSVFYAGAISRNLDQSNIFFFGPSEIPVDKTLIAFPCL